MVSLDLGLNWLKIVWLSLISGIGIGGCLAYYLPKLPFLNDLIKYGKSQSGERSRFHRFIELPKRWFTHFYIVGTAAVSFALLRVVFCYYFNACPSDVWRKWIRFLAAPAKLPTVDEFSVFLTMSALWFQVVRRLMESLFVSVYSNTKMNVVHYVVGCLHYALLPVTILSEAPGFLTSGKFAFNFNAMTYMQMVGVVLFLLASYQQHSCVNILAEMRRNYLGNITTYAHGIPVTYWFEYVSCPHFLFEIIIYLSLYLMLNLKHACWTYVVCFVVCNQVLAALITHQWYKDKFKTLYPTSRRAIIPFIL